MKPLLDEAQIQAGVQRLAREIARGYAGGPVTAIGVLTGSIVFLADLIRHLQVPLRVGVVQARSYRGRQTTRGALEIDASMLPDIRDRDVLLVDDIFDTGHTLSALVEQMRKLRPRSVRTAVLLCKQGRQQVDWRPEFVGFDIPDVFVVGYGLDFDDGYRHLPYVAELEAADLPAGSRD